MATKAELQTVLTCDNKPLINSMNVAAKHASTTGAKMTASFSGLSNKMGAGLAGALSVGAVAAGARALGAFASEIKDLSETTNMTAESFQRYSFAVSQSGGSQEVFVKSMIGVQEAMQKALSGNKEAIASFTKLGISFEEIRTGKPEQILLLMADAMKKGNGDGATFAAIADLIGVKVATKMVPSLKMGSEGFMELANSASVASQKSIDAAEAAQDKWDAFEKRILAIGLNAFDTFTTMVHGGTMTPDFPSGYTPPPSPIPGDTGYVPPAPKAVSNPGEMFGPAWSPQDSKEMLDHQKAMQQLTDEINQITNETAEIEKEAARSTMDSAELINDLTKERAEWLAKAVRYEADIYGLHFKDAALARKRAAEIQSRITGARSRSVENPGEMFGPPVPGRNPGVVNAERGGGGWGALAGFDSFGRVGGGLRTGGLQPSSGLQPSAGLDGSPHSRIRSGDAARRKAEAKQGKDPVVEGVEKVADNTAKMVQLWGGN